MTVHVVTDEDILNIDSNLFDSINSMRFKKCPVIVYKNEVYEVYIDDYGYIAFYKDDKWNIIGHAQLTTPKCVPLYSNSLAP